MASKCSFNDVDAAKALLLLRSFNEVDAAKALLLLSGRPYSDDRQLPVPIVNKIKSEAGAPRAVGKKRPQPGNFSASASLLQRSDDQAAESDKIPIGSGKTLVDIKKYRSINWRSYTVATRTLLFALFPRKILATHSLTGKKSPAFRDKPAKMRLDPKIISDVIIEVQKRFRVKENLIRSIITLKCADECKMFKMRLKKKTTTSAEL